MFDRNNVWGKYPLEKPVATGKEFAEEGMCCVRILEGGDERVQPSEGITGERFCGFSIVRNLSPKSEAISASHEVPVIGDPYIKLQYNNLFVGQLRLVDTTADLDSSYNELTFITVGVPVTPTQILVDYNSGILTFHPDRAGDDVQIFYRHNLTVNQSIQKYLQRTQRDNIDPEVYNIIGVYSESGIIYTDQYDTTKDYSNVGKGELKTGANGLITVGGPGDIVGAVIKIPSIDYPFLGVAYNVVSR